MKIIGIIAEYNPFHNGHAYQIKKIKEMMQADFVVIAMSGNFVQRGTPAIIDKYARTQMALSCGADLVIELPTLWATASAEYFAMAGITLFEKINCIDGICFGAETDNLSLLSRIADTLASEPEDYRILLSSFLKKGLSFPTARSKALCEYFEETDTSGITLILNEPNNILAIEYLKALKRKNSSMAPYLLKREGARYHAKTIIDNISNNENIPTASATAIRAELEKLTFSNSIQSSNNLTHTAPKTVLTLLDEYRTANILMKANEFSPILGYRLLTSDTNCLSNIGDSNTDIANRLFKNRMNFSSFEQFCNLNKSKDVTYTRINRILMHLILNITNQDYLLGKEIDYIPYLRILGFRKNSSVLLKELKNATQVPVISKLADASKILDTNALQILEQDIFAADLYEQICACKKGRPFRSEYTRNIVRI